MTIFRKSLLTLGSAVFIMAAVLIIAVLVFMDSLYYELNAKALSNTTSTLFSVFPREDLRKFFENKNAGRSFPYKEDRYRLTLIEKNGEVLWDSQVERRMVNHIDREEVTAALEGREGQAMRDSLSAGTKQIYSALPVRAADGTVIGVFRLSVEVPSFWQRIAPEAFPFLLLAAVLVIAAFLGIYRFSYSLMASLDRLVDIARETGDFRLSDTGMGETEEILTLEKALRSMSTELKLALGEARMESRRLETILNSMSEAVIATDDKLMLLLINPCARKLFNPLYSAGDANHCSQPLRYTPPRPRTEDSQADVSPRKESLLETTHSTELEWTARKVLETRNPIETEITLCANGTDRHFNVSVAPISLQFPSESGAAGGIVMVMEDRTRIIRLEQIRKDFVANVSHELRTPIQLIKGFSETLLEYSAGQAPHRRCEVSEDSPPASSCEEQFNHYIEIIRKNAGTMENLINDLLSLASLEDDNGFRQIKEDMELLLLFTEALSLVEIQAQKKQINVAIDCDPELKAKLYGSYIIQILVNLLDNAIKYSPSSSQVWARAFRNNKELVLEVKDQGIGIPAEHQDRIFERFYRVDKAHSREAGGTGLGLSIVRHLALLHGGRVELESHAGEGSVFRVLIPEGTENRKNDHQL